MNHAMKKTKLNILFLLLISVLFFSFTKFGKNVTIEGRVENPITGEGISGAETVLNNKVLIVKLCFHFISFEE